MSSKKMGELSFPRTPRSSSLYLIYLIAMLSFFSVLGSSSGSEINPGLLKTRADTDNADLGNSIPITGSTFDLITQKGTWIVKFYAPWCPHCKRLAPFWKSLSLEFKDAVRESDFHFGEVNCDIEEGLRTKYEVHGYPTILLFHNGKKIDDYPGATNSDVELRPYIKEKAEKYKLVNAKSKVKTFDFTKLSQEEKNRLSAPLCFRTFNHIISNGWNFVNFIQPDCPACTDFEPTWYELGSENEDFNLSHVNCSIEQKLCKNYNATQVPLLKLFKDGELVETYPNTSKRDLASLKKFYVSNLETKPIETKPKADDWGTESPESIKKHMKFSDRTVVLTPTNFDATIEEGIWFVLFKSPLPEKHDFDYIWYHLSSDFSQFHQRYGVRFATVDCATEKELCEKDKPENSPFFKIFHLGKLVKTYDNGLSYEILKPIIREQVYQLKQLTRFAIHRFSNQRTPNPDGKLMALQDNAFDLLTNDGPWFVFFKSNRCLDCRALESDWENMATHFKNSVNIAMVQCSTEEVLCKRLKIHSYPYLKFFRDGISRDYNGPSDMESLISFASSASRPHIHIATNSTLPDIHHREASYFLYVYDEAQGLEPLEPILKGQYLLLDVYVVTSKAYTEAGQTLHSTLPYLQIFHNDQATSTFSGAMSDKTLVQKWLATTQYSNVTSLDLTNFDLVMEQYDTIALAVVEPLKDTSAIKQFSTSAVAYKQPNGQTRPMFSLLDGTKWEEYISRVYHKTPKDLPFVVILHPKLNTFKLQTSDGTNLPFQGEPLLKELDLSTVTPIVKHAAQSGLSPTSYLLIFFFCSLALFLFFTYRQKLSKGQGASDQEYNRLHNEE